MFTLSVQDLVNRFPFGRLMNTFHVIKLFKPAFIYIYKSLHLVPLYLTFGRPSGYKLIIISDIITVLITLSVYKIVFIL